MVFRSDQPGADDQGQRGLDSDLLHPRRPHMIRPGAKLKRDFSWVTMNGNSHSSHKSISFPAVFIKKLLRPD
jgi:hypothetical protein